MVAGLNNFEIGENLPQRGVVLESSHAATAIGGRSAPVGLQFSPGFRPMPLSKRLPYLLVATCSILYFLPFLRLLSHQGDEGTLITAAVRVSEGQLPFRDFFEVMGPGTFYWLALFFKLLGTTWLATRICLLFTTLGITLLLFYLARRLRCGMEAVPVIFFVAVSFHNWNAISHHMDSTLLGLASFAALTYWIDQPRRIMLFLAGAGANLTTWIMLQKGAHCVCRLSSCCGFFIAGNSAFAQSLTLLGGYFLTIASGTALFWRAGGLPDLIYANLLWPLTNYSGVNAVPYGLEFRELYWDSFIASFGAVAPSPVAMAISAFLSIPFLIVMGLPLVLLHLGTPIQTESQSSGWSCRIGSPVSRSCSPRCTGKTSRTSPMDRPS